MSKKPELKTGEEKQSPSENLDDDIDVDQLVRIISPENVKSVEGLKRPLVVEASRGKKDTPKTSVPPTAERPKAVEKPYADEILDDPPPITPQKPKTAKSEEEPVEKLAGKIDEVCMYLDELSKGIVKVNNDLKGKIDILTLEIDKLTASLRETSQAVEHTRSEIPGATPSSQTGQRQERETPYSPPSTQPSAYGYQSTPSQQQQYTSRPPPQQQPAQQNYYQQTPPQQPQQQGYYQQPPPQQGYYSQPPPPQGFFQQQQPPPPPPGVSPEDAVSRGAESLRGTVFDDVVSAMNQVASIVFSRLLDAREKILRIDPSFPVQDFEPLLSELRANPRMKLSQVDKRKLIDRMLFWASRLPRQP